MCFARPTAGHLLLTVVRILCCVLPLLGISAAQLSGVGARGLQRFRHRDDARLTAPEAAHLPFARLLHFPIGFRAMINPSAVKLPASGYLASFRSLARIPDRRRGDIDFWHSRVVLCQFQDSRFASPSSCTWLDVQDTDTLCVPAHVRIGDNPMCSASGAEDVRLIPGASGTIMAMFAMLLPAEVPGEQCGDVVMRQFLSTLRPSPQGEWTATRPLQVRCDFSNDPIQKNLSPFWHDGHLYASYRLEPHQVVRLGVDGSCQLVATTSSLQLEVLQHGDAVAHGGSPSVLLPRSNQGGSVFCGVMHLLRPEKKYENRAYKFEATPPFKITAVSRPIPLSEAVAAESAMAIVTGLLIDGARVTLLYGEDDVRSGVLSMSLAQFEALFD